MLTLVLSLCLYRLCLCCPGLAKLFITKSFSVYISNRRIYESDWWKIWLSLCPKQIGTASRDEACFVMTLSAPICPGISIGTILKRGSSEVSHKTAFTGLFWLLSFLWNLQPILFPVVFRNLHVNFFLILIGI